MNNLDYLFLLKIFLSEDEFKKKFQFKSSYYKTLRKPTIFYTLVGYLDDMTIYEIKNVYLNNLGL